MQIWAFARFGQGSTKPSASVVSRRQARRARSVASPQSAVTRTYGSSHELHEARQEMRKQGWYLISAWGENDGRVVALWATRGRRIAAA